MILVNFKKVLEDEAIVEMAKKCFEFNAVIALLPLDVSLVKGEVYSQYINNEFSAEFVKEKGAVGTLLNHSDNQITNEEIKKYVGECKEAGLITIVCCSTTERAKEIDEFKPDFIAIEPNELIGGTVSVSTAKPELISDTVNAVETSVLCGAGVNSKEDVEIALKLGAKGVLVSSAVVKAKDPEKVLKELAKGYRKI